MAELPTDDKDSFITLYNSLVLHLQRLTGTDDPHDSLHDLLNAAEHDKRNRTVGRYKAALLPYASLRNALIHYKGYPRENIANVNPSALAAFVNMVEAICNPTPVYPFCRADVKTFLPEQFLSEALNHMGEKDYSQVVVRKGGKKPLTLLTVEGIARWVAHADRTDILAIPQETPIGDVLPFDLTNAMAMLSRGSTMDDARAEFESVRAQQPRLYAILITDQGKADEKPIGIVTPWDIFREPRQS